ncbi:MAG: phage tail protein [Proteobacteria bacterium]|nr:MAG: phage tail protein [Pseudomonadota bacterium]
MALGEFRFAMDSAAYREFSRTTSWNWPAQERMGKRPARQFTGPGQDEITLAGTIYPHFRGGLGQIKAMRDEANKGEPLILVDGLGHVWGKWVILSIEEQQGEHLGNGVPLRQDFRIKLAAYGDDKNG